MRRARLLLVLSGITFIGFGVASLIWPGTLLVSVGIAPDTAAGRTEIRAMYGGLELAIGLFFLLSARRDDRVEPALLASTLFFFGLGAGRLCGMVLEGQAPAPIPAFLAVEIVAGSLSLWGWSAARSAPAGPTRSGGIR